MPDGADEERPPALHRLRIVIGCVLLATLALKQAPQQVVGDTKLGIALSPWRFLGGALRLWDPSTDFGVTQNQGYGYLFPMGPLFGLGSWLGIDSWVVQRLWWALLLGLAFTGAEALARRLGIGTPATRLLAALAFALSPRLLTTLGPISVESLPYALAPWVLVPLVDGSRGGSPRRAAARSGVAVLCMGAVNAAAVLAALPPAVLFLLTREPGPRKRRLIAWWSASVLLAASWWLLPLVLLGRYSAPFLDHIESAATTTSVTSLVEVLRGTSDWVAYVVGGNGPVWPAGYALLTLGMPIVFSVVLLVAGLSGLLQRDLPERTWLVGTALVGVTALTFGHVGPLSPSWSKVERDLLDGALAPFRNVHKFDVDLRLPLALALAHLLAVLSQRPQPTERGRRLQERAVALGAVAAVLGLAIPAVRPGLAPRGPFSALPGYWKQTAGWLAQHQPGRALVVPGASSVDYYWGNPNDEPLQVLARSPWSVRSAVPLTPSDTIRALDAVEATLAVGQGSSGLAPALARMGVRYLVVRNDLDYGATGSTRPLLVHEALLASPGIRRAAAFGGRIGGGAFGRYADQGLEVPYQAVEVFEVSGTGEPAELLDATADRVVGGPEALPGLLAAGVLSGGPVLLDATSADRVVVTDTPRRREVFFGRQQDNASPTLTADEAFRLDAPAHDYLPATTPLQDLATARYVGATSVTASSSASDAAAFGGAVGDRLPFAAIDGDPATWWSSDPGKATDPAQWRATFPRRSVSGLTVQLGPDSPDTRVEVRTDHERVRVTLRAHQRVPVPLDGETTSLTLRAAGPLALAEVVVPGLVVQRTIDTPVSERADVVSLATTPVRPSCFAVLSSWLCGHGLATGAEDLGVLDRTVRLRTPDSYAIREITARPLPGGRLDAMLQGPVQVTSSSGDVPDPHGDALAAVDGSTGTGWRAAVGDQSPRLTLRWPTAHRLTGITVSVAEGLAVSRPRAITLIAGSDSRFVQLDARGRGTFPPLTTAAVDVHLQDPALKVSVDPYTGETSLAPVGVSELSFAGAPANRPAAGAVDLPCGQGPALRVGDTVVPTRVRTTRQELADLAPVRVVPCAAGPLELGDGTRVRAEPTALLAVTGVVLTRGGVPSAGPAPDLQVGSWGATHRVLRLPARAAATVLEVHENANPGWRATLRGHALEAVTLDGWQQGWRVPAGAAGEVRLSYVPDRTYRWGLLGGGLLALVLLGAAVRRGRPGPPAVAALEPGRWGPLLALAPLVAVGGALAAVLAAVFWAVRRGATLGVAATGVAGLLVAVHPWGTPDYAGRTSVAQALCVAGLAAVWSALLPVRRSRSFRRSAGRSSST